MTGRIGSFGTVLGMTAMGLGLLATVGCRDRQGRTALARTPEVQQEPSQGAAAPAVRLQRLWSGTAFNFRPGASSPSPDGRYVTEIDWSTGDLAVRALVQGGLHRLTDKGTWQKSGDYALSSVFSPGGDQVAYTWWNTSAQRNELRVLDFDVDAQGTPRGSGVRVVSSSPGPQPYAVFGWSSSGDILVSVRRADRTWALALVAVSDARLRILESFDWRVPHAALSPDGRLVAYDLRTDNGALERDVHVVAADGTWKATLTHEDADDMVMGWEPGGSLLRARIRSARAELWRQRFDGRNPSGPSELAYEDLIGRVSPLGFAGGALYFGLTVEAPTFAVAELDLENGQVVGTPASIEPPSRGRMDAWAWSPDGRHYAVAIRGDSPESGYDVVIRSVDGSDVQSFHGDGRVERLRWAEEPQALFLYSVDGRDRPGIRALDLASGEVRTVREFHRPWGAMGGHFDVSPDGRAVYFRALAEGARVSRPTEGAILALDVGSGSERRIQQVRWGGSLAVSPDGRFLAFVDFDAEADSTALRVTAVDGGESRVVTRAHANATISGLNWTPDGNNILYLAGSPGGADRVLRLVPATGGVPRTLQSTPDLRDAEPRLHPGGRKIAVLTGESRGEIWALEGLEEAGVADRSSDSR